MNFYTTIIKRIAFQLCIYFLIVGSLVGLSIYSNWDFARENFMFVLTIATILQCIVEILLIVVHTKEANTKIGGTLFIRTFKLLLYLVGVLIITHIDIANVRSLALFVVALFVFYTILELQFIFRINKNLKKT